MSFILQPGAEIEGTQALLGIYEREEGIQIDYSTLEAELKVIFCLKLLEMECLIFIFVKGIYLLFILFFTLVFK